MKEYVAKQRSNKHVIVRFHDSSSEGKLAYYLYEKEVLLGKRQTNQAGSSWYPIREPCLIYMDNGHECSVPLYKS
jgi:hypothetical protein